MRTKFHAALLSLLCLSTFSSTQTIFAQGNLNPPGPPAPMFRTLEEVQPRRPIGTNTTPGDTNALFVILQPGSYYLTTNITGVAGKHGIFIAVNGVTLDLMGFELVGVSNALNGIMTGQSISNIVVRNGTVRNWQFGLDSRATRNSLFSDLRVSDNSLVGLGGGFGSTVFNCVARGNKSTGIFAQNGSVLSGCSASFNGNGGISASASTSIIGCTALGNSGSGIFAGDSSRVSGCTARANVRGITVVNSMVVSCASGGNEFDGIVAQHFSSVSGCTANENGEDGINVSGWCRVVDNTCIGNGTAVSGSGIRAVFDGKNRIENNHVTDNSFAGINVAIAGNLIMRNSASGNGTNYVIVAGNKVGPIVAAPSSGAISGDTGGAGVGTTDPWANFSY